MLPVLRQMSRWALGYDVTGLDSRLTKLEGMLRAIAPDQHRLWLYENRDERMDATLDIFDMARRAFHLARYEFATQYVAGLVVADIACGTGYGTELVVLRGGARRAVGVDVDEAAVAYARAKHQPAGAEFICAGGTNTGLPARSLDAVISFETIEHLPDDKALLTEFHRLLRPQGLLIISTPNNWPIEASPTHVRTYDLRTFREILDRQFEMVEVYNQNSGTNSPYNHGQPAGICCTTPANEALAECLIAVCRARKN